MAEYKYKENLSQSSSAAFDTRYAPGSRIENAGIYRCTACGDEIALPKKQPLPDHKHAAEEGKVEWKLLVYAQPNK